MNALEWVILILAVALAAGYWLGTVSNHRRAEAILLRLREELQLYGTLSKLKAAGPRAMGFRLLPRSGRLQFVDFTVTLEPRHLLPVWLWQHLRGGGGDTLYVQANSLPAPHFDIRVFPQGEKASLHRLEQSGKPFKLLDEAEGFAIYVRGVGAPSSRDALPDFIRNHAAGLRSLAIQSEPPHIQACLRVKGARSISWSILFQSLSEIIK